MDSIGFFQLENLMIVRSSFVFLDLREDRERVLPAPLDQYLKGAQAVGPAQAVSLVQTMAVPKAQPVVLISEDGQVCPQVGRDLEAAGYTNVYMITGGVVGLLSEL